MKTFAEKFCAEHGCDLRAFEWRVFWRSVHRRALPVTPLALCFFPDHFTPDWDLIRAAARCYTLRQVEEEILGFSLDSANRSWWRRVAKVRLSAQRFRRLARHSFHAGQEAASLSRGPLPR